MTEDAPNPTPEDYEPDAVGDEAPSPPEGGGDAAMEASAPAPVIKGDVGLDKAQTGMSAFLVLFVGAAIFSNAFTIPFLYDARDLFVHSDAFHTVADAGAAHTTVEDLRPLTAVSYGLNWQTLPNNPRIFHFFNVVLHLLTSVLVFLLARRIVGKDVRDVIPMAAGALFAAHPIVTQAVNHLPDRGALLGTFFGLAAIVLFLRATEDDRMDGRGLALSGILFLCAWGSSSAWFVLPLLLLLADGAARGWPSGRRLSAHGAFVGLAVLLVLVRGVGSGEWLSFSGFLGEAATFGEGVGRLVYPVGLSPYHEALEGGGVPLVWAGAVVVGLVLLRVLPGAGFVLLWTALGLGAAGFYDAGGALDESHWYLPAAGFAVLLPVILTLLSEPPVNRIVGVASAVVIILFGALTFLRNQDWHDEEALWTRAAESCETCYEPRMKLGGYYVEQGEYALALYRQSTLEGDPSGAATQRDEANTFFRQAAEQLAMAAVAEDVPARVWLDLGTAQRYTGESEAAMESLTKAMRLDLESQETALHLAQLKEEAAAVSGDPGERQAALDYYRKAESLGPLPDPALERLGLMMARMGALDESIGYLERAIARSPNSPVVVTLNQVKQAKENLENVQNAIRQRTQQGDTGSGLVELRALELYLSGNYLQSSYFVHAVLNEAPATFPLWVRLGLCAAKMDSFDQFLAEWPDPPAGTEDLPPWTQFAKQCATVAEWDAALRALRHDKEANPERAIPLVSLADIALELGDRPRALALLTQASQEHPEAYAPWLRRASMAIDDGRPDDVRTALREATAKGAPEPELADLREKANLSEEDLTRPVRTIIRQ